MTQVLQTGVVIRHKIRKRFAYLNRCFQRSGLERSHHPEVFFSEDSARAWLSEVKGWGNKWEIVPVELIVAEKKPSDYLKKGAIDGQ